jgi:large subunit ribosomal protein L17
MRHGDKINNLGRKSAHRQALMMNLAIALIENKRIFTTLAKAKALRTYVEPLITRSKEDTTHSRRLAFSYLKNKEAVSTLFKDVAVKVAERNGGYTRIIKTGNRQGDAAEMAMIELVDFNEVYTGSKKAAGGAKAKSTRRRGKKTTAKAKAAPAEAKSEDAKSDEGKAE